jgi:hypothetical protein
MLPLNLLDSNTFERPAGSLPLVQYFASESVQVLAVTLKVRR